MVKLPHGSSDPQHSRHYAHRTQPAWLLNASPGGLPHIARSPAPLNRAQFLESATSLCAFAPMCAWCRLPGVFILAAVKDHTLILWDPAPTAALGQIFFSSAGTWRLSPAVFPKGLRHVTTTAASVVLWCTYTLPVLSHPAQGGRDSIYFCLFNNLQSAQTLKKRGEKKQQKKTLTFNP